MTRFARLRRILRPRNLGLAALVMVLPSAAMIADAQAAPSVTKGTIPGLVQMTCRGPFLLGVGSTATFSAKKAATAAGGHGRNLASGECALFDRALNASERPIVDFSFSTALNPTERNQAAVSALSACAIDENCVVTVVSTLGADVVFHADPGRQFSIHKFGRHPDQ